MFLSSLKLCMFGGDKGFILLFSHKTNKAGATFIFWGLFVSQLFKIFLKIKSSFSASDKLRPSYFECG